VSIDTKLTNHFVPHHSNKKLLTLFQPKKKLERSTTFTLNNKTKQP